MQVQHHGKPRILVLVTSFCQGRGGVPESTLMLARQLARVGLSVDVLAAHGLYRSAESLEALPPAGSRGAATVNTTAGYSAVLINGPWNRRAPWLALDARQRQVPLAYAPHGGLARAEFRRLRDLRKIPYLLLIEWLVIGLARTVICTSRLEVRHSLLPPKVSHKVVVLPNPLSPPLPVRRRQPSRFTIGFLAELGQRKNLATAAQGYIEFVRRRPDADCEMIIGGSVRSGAERYVRAVAEELSRANVRVRWLGPVTRHERAAFYASISVALVPSKFESFGLTVIEALVAGVPVITTRSVGVLEFLTDSCAVMILEQATPAAIADRLESVYSSPCVADANSVGIAALSSLDLAAKVAEVAVGSRTTRKR